MRFHSGEIAVQERAGVRDIAEDVGEGIVDHLPPGASEFLERRQMAVLGTVDNSGHVWASVVTGDPGFIETIDDRTLRIAARASSSDPLFRNLATEGHAALFAPDFVSSRRVRVNGRGVIRDGAIFITTEEVYGNCRRYLQERIFVGNRKPAVADQTASVATTLSASQQQQISHADTFFIATDNPERGADVSHKGGNPGFVRVLDEQQDRVPRLQRQQHVQHAGQPDGSIRTPACCSSISIPAARSSSPVAHRSTGVPNACAPSPARNE